MTTATQPPATALQSLLQRAATLLQRGDAANAGVVLQQAVTAHPDSAGAHHAMSIFASRIGRHDIALRHVARAAALAPDQAALQLAHGCLLAHHGQFQSALAPLKASTSLSPENAQAWYFLGITLARCQRDPEALDTLRKARMLAPDSLQIRNALADTEFHAGYPEDALPLWRERAAEQPDDTDVTLKLGETLSRLQYQDQAETIYEQALQRQPDNADLWMAAAQAYEDNGKRDEAEAAYTRSLELRSHWAFPLAGILGLRRGDADEALVVEAVEQCSRNGTPDRDVALVGYELGKVFDARNHFEEAMQCWHQANQARRRMVGEFDFDSLHARVDRMLPVFGADVLARAPLSAEERPLFIVGMPRSGTTLTEQILAAHSRVHGCGELPHIALIARHLPCESGSTRVWPHIVDDLSAAHLDDATQRYLAAATRHAPDDALRLVDKAPMNYYALGLISWMFPHARIVWCRRDPRDVAISIYGENFSLGERFANRLDSIGRCITLHERLMAHWQKVLPNPILELSYERLVTEPEAQARRLLEFAGLDWDPTCLDFHASERGVQTPSRWQVKQPIHARSVGRWKNYAFALDPLLEQLDPASLSRHNNNAL